MAFEIGVLLAIGALVFWGIEELFLKESIAKIGIYSTLLLNTVTGIFVDFFLIFVVFSSSVILISAESFWIVFFVGLLLYVEYIFFYKALQKQELSLISALDETWILVSIPIAIFFFGEFLTPLHAFAIGIALLGAFFISVNVKHLRKMRLISGAKYELLSIGAAGVSSPLIRIVTEDIGEFMAFFYLDAIILLFIFMHRFVGKTSYKKPNLKQLKIVVASGIADGFAFAFFVLAIAYADISVVTPIVASTALVAVILGRLILKEKTTLWQKIGIGLVIAAVVILANIA